MRFRPCIDLRHGQVVQIVGASLRDGDTQAPVTNFATECPATAYAQMYRDDAIPGGHVIALGPGNQEAALAALRAFPGGMHMGGGITPDNAALYLEAGASHVIVTSYVFQQGQVNMARLHTLVQAVGRQRLVLDLSCRQRDGVFWVVTDRWQQFTEVPVNQQTLAMLAVHCDAFLVHGVDVEGTRLGIDETLVELLGAYSPLPVTYAGGANALEDLERVKRLGQGRVDLTIGSALDIFGGNVPYQAVIAWQRQQERAAEVAGTAGRPVHESGQRGL
ncbi:MAG: phosphoribosylformimino-5-aminoimidazole carboxamide ribotide isomerase [Candidatus Tectomicrobia bacterium]|uniref:Phosphoribosylformimino-5-aminoimidazole carboxamide ribotide isomerase n=1 Tax=Tectimicrobiota bacterium TaxID=2528274 RepID=A0A937W0T6_UNCTE|nr:phosphoribosylformimino-5-aminoimidazole carboxamide ribotide isomerase [Candidatus Tectomicrobia bacterium]